jgi:hypothetical protein
MSLTITTRPLSHHIHISRVRSSLTNVRAACISDRAEKNPHCPDIQQQLLANQKRPLSFLASQPVITKDLAFPSADPSPLPPPNSAAKLERGHDGASRFLRPPTAAKSLPNMDDQKISLWHLRRCCFLQCPRNRKKLRILRTQFIFPAALLTLKSPVQSPSLMHIPRKLGIFLNLPCLLYLLFI